MLNITVMPEAARTLRTILDKEDDPDAVFRIREFKSGCSCSRNLQIVLRVSLDAQEDDDLAAQADGLPFVLADDLAPQYGTDLVVSLDSQGMFLVAPRAWTCGGASGCALQ